MRNPDTTALATVPVWMVELRLQVARGGRPPLSDDDLEPMVELLYRTAGTHSVAVVPEEAGLAVAMGLEAADAAAAVERALALSVSCARYAGIGEVTVARTAVTAEPGAGTA